MLKVLILQAMHSLLDDRCDYLIKDWLSFMRFLGLGLAGAGFQGVAAGLAGLELADEDSA